MGIELNLESFTYPDGTQLFGPLNLSVTAGRALAVVGPSGVGKSTLISLLAGLHPEPLGGIWRGQYLLDSRNLGSWSPQERVTKLGYLGPNSKLFLTGFCSTVREEVGWSLFGLSWKIEAIEQRVSETLQELGISHLSDATPHHLSGGQQQMVALASVWARQPSYLLLDNPVSSLDPEARSNLIKQTQRLIHRFGTTVVFATARAQDVDWCEAVCSLQPGRDSQQASLICTTLAQWVPSQSGCLCDEGKSVTADGKRGLDIPAHPNESVSQAEVDPAIEVEALRYTPPGHTAPLFDLLHWRVERGETVALLGANGSGKSTLGRILRGLERAAGGSVLVAGKAVDELSVPDLTPFVAYTFQEPSNLFLQRSVSDELLYSGQLLGLRLEVSQARKEQALELFNLKGVQGRHPRELCESQGALLGLALSWFTQAQVQILDEPSGRLDAEGRSTLESVLGEWRAEGITVVLIDHDEAWVRRQASRRFVLKNGRLS